MTHEVSHAQLQKQLDAIDAQLELLRVMVAALRHTLTAPAARRADEAPLPARCTTEAEEHCGRRNPDAIVTLGGMGTSARQLMCRGCGLDPRVP